MIPIWKNVQEIFRREWVFIILNVEDLKVQLWHTIENVIPLSKASDQNRGYSTLLNYIDISFRPNAEDGKFSKQISPVMRGRKTNRKGVSPSYFILYRPLSVFIDYCPCEIVTNNLSK